jgi:hypothetical protein
MIHRHHFSCDESSIQVFRINGGHRNCGGEPKVKPPGVSERIYFSRICHENLGSQVPRSLFFGEESILSMM